jgi:sulfite reductase (NADPH) flavoprotein alpha-component
MARFRLGENARRPLLLIGNGSGLAGLRALLRARIDAGRARELAAVRRAQCRARLPAARRAAKAGSDRPAGALRPRLVARRRRLRYVQDRLLAEGAGVRDWIARGAAVYVCGSLEGMAAGVDAALREILGADGVRL